MSAAASAASKDAPCARTTGSGCSPPRLTIPRLDTPRTKTPPGSVGIGGTQGTIYAVDSPGGFWVLGRTPLRLYDPAAAEPSLLRAGDHVRFRLIDRAEYDAIAAAVADGRYTAHIETASHSARIPSPPKGERAG